LISRERLSDDVLPDPNANCFGPRCEGGSFLGVKAASS
jgi:hypothetical protein